MSAKHKICLRTFILLYIALLSCKVFAQEQALDPGKTDDQTQTSKVAEDSQDTPDEPAQPKSNPAPKKHDSKSNDGLHHDRTHTDLRDKANHPELEVDTD